MFHLLTSVSWTDFWLRIPTPQQDTKLTFLIYDHHSDLARHKIQTYLARNNSSFLEQWKACNSHGLFSKHQCANMTSLYFSH